MASAGLAALLLGLASISAGAAYAQSENPIFVQTQPTAISQAFRADIPAADRAAVALTERAQRAGGIRVIAELKSITDIDDTLSPSASLKQAAKLTRAQNAMLGRVLKGAATTGIRRYQFIPFVALKVNAAQLKRLLADPDIASVEEDTFAKPQAKAEQWDIAKISLPAVWKLGVKGTGYTVAVLDTGFQDDHPMLAGRFVSEACYSTTQRPIATSLCKGGAQSSIA
jgi:subtilisin family serine protease